MLVGQENPYDGLLRGTRVDSAAIGGRLQDGQAVGGLSPSSRATASHLDLQKGWHGRRRAGEVGTIAHSLQQLLLPLLQGIQFTGVLLVGLAGGRGQR